MVRIACDVEGDYLNETDEGDAIMAVCEQSVNSGNFSVDWKSCPRSSAHFGLGFYPALRAAW